jgi:hypothetical protein
VAEAVKFIGQAVRVLRKPCGEFKAQELLPAGDTLAATESLSRLQEQPVFNRMAFEHTIEQVCVLPLLYAVLIQLDSLPSVTPSVYYFLMHIGLYFLLHTMFFFSDRYFFYVLFASDSIQRSRTSVAAGGGSSGTSHPLACPQGMPLSSLP